MLISSKKMHVFVVSLGPFNRPVRLDGADTCLLNQVLDQASSANTGSPQLTVFIQAGNS